MQRIVEASKKNIQIAADIIRKGGIVAFPTETVYGLGADAFNPDAVIRIFKIKQRPEFFPLIVHISERADTQKLYKEVSPQAVSLMDKFWPGPLTIVLEKKERVPDIVTSGNNTVGVRMPSNKAGFDFIRCCGTPIAAPSANRSGSISPTDARTVFEQLGDSVDLILDAGSTEVGIESTVISLLEKPVILRPGCVPKEDIEKVIGKVNVIREEPRPFRTVTPFEFLKSSVIIPDNNNLGFLAFAEPKNLKKRFKAIEVLSAGGDLWEAGKNLFEKLHKLDKMNLDKVYMEELPEEGMGLAIMQKLRKLAVRD
ncbi:MAG: L-threonylcarbamoyladenylate synthase [bacterium]|nr:L-threonylcarbamoyladenylate synthase [bacterium]